MRTAKRLLEAVPYDSIQATSIIERRFCCNEMVHPTSGAPDQADFGPVSPALEHFLHPAPGVAGSSVFEPVSPALEHLLHRPSGA